MASAIIKTGSVWNFEDAIAIAVKRKKIAGHGIDGGHSLLCELPVARVHGLQVHREQEVRNLVAEIAPGRAIETFCAPARQDEAVALQGVVCEERELPVESFDMRRALRVEALDHWIPSHLLK